MDFAPNHISRPRSPDRTDSDETKDPESDDSMDSVILIETKLPSPIVVSDDERPRTPRYLVPIEADSPSMNDQQEQVFDGIKTNFKKNKFRCYLCVVFALQRYNFVE